MGALNKIKPILQTLSLEVEEQYVFACRVGLFASQVPFQNQCTYHTYVRSSTWESGGAHGTLCQD